MEPGLWQYFRVADYLSKHTKDKLVLQYCIAIQYCGWLLTFILTSLGTWISRQNYLQVFKRNTVIIQNNIAC